ncbi:MAG: hypothetical protein ABSA76_06240 [Bacteroidales bacterium]
MNHYSNKPLPKLQEIHGRFVVYSPALWEKCPTVAPLRDREAKIVLFNSIREGQNDPNFDNLWDVVITAEAYYKLDTEENKKYQLQKKAEK